MLNSVHTTPTDRAEVALYYVETTQRLDNLLPSTLWWFTNIQICGLLNISESTRRRDAAILRSLGLIKSKHRRGLPREDVEILFEFRQLQKWADRDEAVDLITDVVEVLRNEKKG